MVKTGETFQAKSEILRLFESAESAGCNSRANGQGSEREGFRSAKARDMQPGSN
jgi:hypothetical protein